MGDKTNKMALNKGLWLVILVSLILCIGVVSALDFDNVKSYDANTKTITITNAFGLGGNLAKITLNTPQIVYVIPGSNRKVAEFTIDSYNDYTSALKQMQFYNVKNNKEFSRTFTYKQKVVTGTKKVNDYKTECKEELGKQSCYQILTGAHNEDIYEWQEYKTLNTKQEKITIGIFTDVYSGDNVEWQPTLFGVKITEWATWTDAMNVGLIHYYTFNETSGFVGLDSRGRDIGNQINATLYPSTRFTTGKIGNSVYFNATAGMGSFNVSLGTSMPVSNFTISMWVFKNDTIYQLNPKIFEDTNAIFRLYMSSASQYYILDDVNSADPVQINNTWQFLTVVNNITGNYLYLNNTIVVAAPLLNLTSTNFIFGSSADYLNRFEGRIDEVGIWNRSLSSSEITDLWNNGLGMTYTTIVAPSITLNYPIDNYNNITSPYLNCTGTSILSNMQNLSIYVDGIIKQTLSSGTQNNLSIRYLPTLGFGSHNWTCLGTDITNLQSWATNRTLIISQFIENSQTYNPITIETTSETFAINFTYISSLFYISSVLLNYDGTNYSASSLDTGSTRIYSANIIIPSVSTETNKTFYFIVALLNSTGDITNFISNSNNQTINKMHLYQCDATTGLALNFTTYDGTNFTALNSSFEASFNYYGVGGTGSTFINTTYQNLNENQSNFMFCLNSSGLNATLNAFINYYATGYDSRSYIISNGIIGNFTQNIPLFLSLTLDTDIITFNIMDSNYNPLSNALVNIQQWNVGTNSFFSIGMFTTSSEGTGILNLVLYNIWYRASVTYQGQLIKVTDIQKLSGTTWNIIVDLGVSNPYDLFGTISHGLTFSNTTNITTFTWSDSSGYTQQGCLLVYNLTSYGQVEAYNYCVISNSNTINYLLNGDGTYYLKGIIYLTSAYNVSSIVDTLTIRLGEPEMASVISSFGKVLSFIFIGTSAMIGVAAANPIYGLILLIASLFVSAKLGWLNIGWGILMGFIVIIIVIIFRIGRKGG